MKNIPQNIFNLILEYDNYYLRSNKSLTNYNTNLFHIDMLSDGRIVTLGKFKDIDSKYKFSLKIWKNNICVKEILEFICDQIIQITCMLITSDDKIVLAVRDGDLHKSQLIKYDPNINNDKFIFTIKDGILTKIQNTGNIIDNLQHTRALCVIITLYEFQNTIFFDTDGLDDREHRIMIYKWDNGIEFINFLLVNKYMLDHRKYAGVSKFDFFL